MVQNLLARGDLEPRIWAALVKKWEKNQFLPHREQTVSAVQRKLVNAAV
jgi:hypothetical protein